MTAAGQPGEDRPERATREVLADGWLGQVQIRFAQRHSFKREGIYDRCT
jgi:hypothetical protein